MNRFKISACSANYGRADLLKVIERLGALDYDGIEITVMYHAVPDQTSPARRKEIKARIREAGLKTCALHFIFAPGLQMAVDDAAQRERVVEHVGSVIDLAQDLDAPRIVFGGGGVRAIPQGVAREEGEKRVVEGLAKIARRAEPSGTVICLEALNRYEANLGRTLADCSAIVDRVGSPMLKVAGDTFHMNIEESSMPAAIEATGARLAHLQLPDSHRMAPGGGHIDFVPIFRSLRKIGYDGYLSFEIFWIAPELPHLPTWDACDDETSKAIKHVREIERAT